MHRVTPLVLLLACLGCTPRGRTCGGSDVAEFQSSNLLGRSFGLADKELALTFDDGPGEASLALARHLAAKKVPATFFMQASQAQSRLDVVRQIADLTIDGKPAHLIANHTWSHPELQNGRLAVARSEISRADELLAPFIKGTKFFRAPYGAYGGSVMASGLNAHGNLARYIGPVYWDIGGELRGGFAADWACWSQGVSVGDCGNRYVNEAVARGRGIVLAHDIHRKTVEMFLGGNGASPLVDKLVARGFRFVRLDAHEDAVRRFGEVVGAGQDPVAPASVEPSPSPGPDSEAEVRFSVTPRSDGALAFWIDVLGGDAVRIAFDGASDLLIPEQRARQIVFVHGFDALGKHSLDVQVLTGGRLVARQSFLFEVKSRTSAGLREVRVDGRTLDLPSARTERSGEAMPAAPSSNPCR